MLDQIGVFCNKHWPSTPKISLFKIIQLPNYIFLDDITILKEVIPPPGQHLSNKGQVQTRSYLWKNLICNYSKIQNSYKRRGERFKSLFSAEIRFIDRCPVLLHPCLQPTHWINNSTETTKPIITSVVKLEAKVNEQTTQLTANFLQNLSIMEQEHLLTRKSNLSKTLDFFTWKTSQVATYSFCTDESRSLSIVSSKISQAKCFLIK